MEHDEDWHGRLCAVVADEPPVRIDRDEVVALAQRFRRRRRARAAMGSAAVGVATIAVVVSLLTSLGGDGGSGPAAAPSATVTPTAYRTGPWPPMDPDPCGLAAPVMVRMNGAPPGPGWVDLRHELKVTAVLSDRFPAGVFLQRVEVQLLPTRPGVPPGDTYAVTAQGAPRTLSVTIPPVTQQRHPVTAGRYRLRVTQTYGGGEGMCGIGHAGGETLIPLEVRTG